MIYTIEDQIQRDRNNHGAKMAAIMNSLFKGNQRYIDQEEDRITLLKVQQLVQEMHKKFDSMSEEEKRTYLDGEFATYYIGPDNDLSEGMNAPKYPLYLFADISLITISSLYLYNPNISVENKNIATELKADLETLRSKLAELNFSEKFDKNKHVSQTAWQGMNACGGNYSIRREQKEGVEYFEMNYSVTTDDGVWKNGDYYYDNVYTSHGNSVLFEEDSKEIWNRKINREKKESEIYFSHFKKYFKNGIIPDSYQGFEEHLISQDLDQRIIKALGSLVLMYNAPENKHGFVDFAHSKYAIFYLEDLQRAERLVEKEAEEQKRLAEEKKSAIDKARERYQQKNFFWKFINRKLNPQNLNFETMETSEIQELYTGGKRRK